ncbi:hypothetical protein [Synechococcus sp. GFB01]|uniref:hypothetical protein n=1 Tax=Synechococcus sp. GFB01 TaxID=1662190 RepID=UPI00064F9D2B|nr:hypothetical protein [Synechococcus sp. GFB01]KMM16498.1 hypothetical protein SYNGFB01_10990 [Synechococcus sp. GFB01]
MKRQSMALFLTTVALAGGTLACGKAPEAGEQGGDQEQQQQQHQTQPAPANQNGGEGGEGGEG